MRKNAAHAPKRKGKALWIIGGIILAVIALAIWVNSILSPVTFTSGYSFMPKYFADEYTLTFDNGDTVYTPNSDHIALDDGRALLYYNNLLLVFTKHDLTAQEQAELADTVGGRVAGQISGAIHAVQILVDNASLAELEAKADTLMQQEPVMYAYCDYPVQIMGAADSNPWSIDSIEEDRGNESSPDGADWWAEAIGAYTAWEYTAQCQSVKVGIADSGFAVDHEDLKGQIVLVGKNSNDLMDDHGIHVSGIIGALNNDVGIRGIADTAQLYCADLWHEEDPDSYHTMAEYLAVINHMAENGVKVVNNSWGCISYSKKGYAQALYGTNKSVSDDEYEGWLDRRLNQDLIPTAAASISMLAQLDTSGYGDMLIVQAAGNGHYDNGESIDARYNGFFCSITESVFESLPACLRSELDAQGITYRSIDEQILIVGAAAPSRKDNQHYYMTDFSNFGETIDICAPGADILSTVSADSGLYELYSGTSMAAPMVTAGAAFLWSLNPELTGAEVRSILLDCTDTVAMGVGNGKGYTYPMLNIGQAAQYVLAEMEP